MKLMRILRTGVAGALIASVPVTASVAATRPASAVPVVSTAAVTATQVYDDNYDARPAIAWPAVAVMAAALIVGLWLVLDDDNDGEGSVSRG